MSEFLVTIALIAPQFVAGMQEVVYDGGSVNAIEWAVFKSDVVKAEMIGVNLKTFAIQLMICVEVDVVIERVVVYHLGDRYAIEELR